MSLEIEVVMPVSVFCNTGISQYRPIQLGLEGESSCGVYLWYSGLLLRNAELE